MDGDRRPFLSSGVWPHGTTTTADSTYDVPEGATYTLTEDVSLAAGVTISGGGTIVLAGGRFLAQGNNVTFDGVTVVAGSPTTLLVEQSSGAYTGWSFADCVFDNVSVRLTAPGRTQSDGSTATNGTAVTGSMTDCEHRNYAGNYTIEVATNGVTITRPWVHHNGVDINAGDGIKVLAGATGCQIIDPLIHDNTRDGIDVYDGDGVTVTGGTISDNGALGIDAKWATTDANSPSNHTFTGITLERNGGGIGASAPGTTVADCVCVDNTSFGIRVGSAQDDATAYTETVSVTGNTCTGSETGIVLGNAVRYVTVDGNTCTGNNYGVTLSALSDQCTITNNDLNPNDVDDLVQNGTSHTISGNT